MNTRIKTCLIFSLLFYVFSCTGNLFYQSECYKAVYAILNKLHIFLLAYAILVFANDKKDILLLILSKAFFWNCLVRLAFEVLFLGGIAPVWYYPVSFVATNGLLYYFLIYNPKNNTI